jgi:CO/xanthine dehydrogenase FAD-binding subunit
MELESVGAAVSIDRMHTAGTRALRQAAAAIGTAPLRAQATVAGNIAGSGPRCLLPVFLAFGARAKVLAPLGLADYDLGEALKLGKTLVSLQWEEPQFSSYRKIREGRSGMPTLAVATALHASPDEPTHVHIAVWHGRKIFCEALHAHGGTEEALEDLKKTQIGKFSLRDIDIIRTQIAEVIAMEES